MNDNAKLLGQLKIDRGNEPLHRGSRRGVWLIASAVVLLLALLGVGLLLRDRGVPVSVAVATPLSSGGGTASLLDASGYVVARRQATVSSKITGKLRDLYIEEGQRIEAGSVMARLDDANAQAALAQAQASVAQAQLALDNQQPLYQRAQQLHADGISSDEALQASKASFDALRMALRVNQASLLSAQRNLDDTVVRAPFTGVITTKAAQPGEIVSPISAGGGFTRTGIGTLVDMESLEVEVDVNENFINRVQSGAPVRVRLNAYPDWEIPAAVIAVIPTADRSKATVKVRVGFKARDPRILPEMGARVSFLSEPDQGTSTNTTKGLSLPEAAVLREQAQGDSGVVYVINGERVERRAVRLGASSKDQVTVLSGLAAGDRVAVGDWSKLHDGAIIKLSEP